MQKIKRNEIKSKGGHINNGKGEFQVKSTKQDKEGHHIMIPRHNLWRQNGQNLYIPNSVVVKYKKQKLLKV